MFPGNFFKMINKVTLTGKLRKNTTAIHVCKTSIFYFQGRNIYRQGSYFHVAFTVYSFIKTNVGRNATQYVALKVTRPSFLGGYHPTLKLSGIPTFTFIVSITHRMDNI